MFVCLFSVWCFFVVVVFCFIISRCCCFLFVCVLVFYLFVYFLLILFFVVAASEREGCVLSSFCVSFLLSFCRGKGYFILRVGRVRDSSSAGQSLT